MVLVYEPLKISLKGIIGVGDGIGIAAAFRSPISIANPNGLLTGMPGSAAAVEAS
jgi:hypothetical protein